MTTMIENKESLQEIALRYLNDGVFIFDKDRKIVLFNPACEQIVGFSVEEITKNESSCFDIFRLFHKFSHLIVGRHCRYL